MNQRGHMTAIRLAGAAVAAALASGAATAATPVTYAVTGTPLIGGGTQSVSTGQGAGGFSFGLPQTSAYVFTAPAGVGAVVLKGVDFDYNATLTSTTSASVVGVPGASGPASVSADFTNAVSLTGSNGVSSQGQMTVTAGCTGASAGAGCSGGAAPSQAFNVHQSITDVASLQAFANGGAFGASTTLSAMPTDLLTSANGTGASVSDTATLTPSAVTLTYDYLGHANASFASGSTSFAPDITSPFGGGFPPGIPGLDPKTDSMILFGTQGTTVMQSGAIFNLGGAGTDGLDLDAITAVDPGPFSLSLASFSDLAGGASQGFVVTLNTDTAGAFTGQFQIEVSDAAAEGGIGRQSYLMTLNLQGFVAPDPNFVPPTPGVPEPASWALLIAGFGLTGAALRRRRLPTFAPA